MKRKVEKYFSNILNSFLLLHPVLDLLTSIGIKTMLIPFSLGSIIRILFLIFVMYSVLFVYKKRKVGWYYLFTFIYIVGFVISIVLYENGNNMLGELQKTLKTFYFPLLLISIYPIKAEIKWSTKHLITTLMIYLILIFIPEILNIGFDSYEITKEGSVGFFYSANEISAIVSILTPLFILYLFDGKINITKVFIFIIYITVILNLGTKTPFLALIITSALFMFWFLMKKKILKSLLKTYILALTLIAVVTLGAYIIPKTTFYKNINIHLDFLEVKDINDIFEDPQLIDHFIFSQRLSFLDNKAKIYEKVNIPQKMFGIGYYENNKESKMIEMDYFDIYYSHGIIGFVLFFSIYTYILIDIVKKSYLIIKDKKTYSIFICIIFILVLSLFTGHIIIAPAVSYISVYIIMYLEKACQNKIKKLN